MELRLGNQQRHSITAVLLSAVIVIFGLVMLDLQQSTDGDPLIDFSGAAESTTTSSLETASGRRSVARSNAEFSLNADVSTTSTTESTSSTEAAETSSTTSQDTTQVTAPPTTEATTTTITTVEEPTTLKSTTTVLITVPTVVSPPRETTTTIDVDPPTTKKCRGRGNGRKCRGDG